LIFGHRNMYPPMFNMTSYSATISMEMPIATAVLIIHAYDIDKDTFSFEIENSDNVAFSIGTQDGVIRCHYFQSRRKTCLCQYHKHVFLKQPWQ
jgi:hypothetical protein